MCWKKVDFLNWVSFLSMRLLWQLSRLIYLLNSILQAFSQDYNLASHSIQFICVLILFISSGTYSWTSTLNNRKKVFMEILVFTRINSDHHFIYEWRDLKSIQNDRFFRNYSWQFDLLSELMPKYCWVEVFEK